MSVTKIKSPCVGICNLDFSTHTICQGCGRAVDDIANWSSYTNEEKLVAIESATKRMKEING